MQGYFWFIFRRTLQLLAVVFSGISAAFFISHLSPISPVEQALARITSRSNFSPEAIDAMRSALTDLYGVNEPLFGQFLSFWRRALMADFGPSLIAFPSPAMDLVMRALPWTMGLLATAIIIQWVVGNVLGGLAGYYQNNRILKAFGVVSMGLQPIPHYIVGFVLLIVFGFLWPILPISGGFAMNVRVAPTPEFALSILQHAILPAGTLVLVGMGGWFLGMRALVSNIVTEDYVTYAELAGVNRNRIVGSYVIRNAMVPQITALAMTLGGIFSGTVIVEVVFSYPGLGSLLVDAVEGGDYSLVLAVSTVAIASVAVAIFIVDLLYPLLDPRVKVE